MIGRRIALAALPALAAMLASCIPQAPAGVFLGAVLALPLLVAGALLASVTSSSVRANALCGASATFVRIGGAGLIAILVLHDPRARAMLATMAICLFIALAVDVAARMRELSQAFAAGRAASSTAPSAPGAAAHE